MGYTDLTTEFVYKGLVTFLNMDALAENDAFDVLLSGTKAIFGQAAVPTGWTKDVSNNDKFLRVVSGASGGSPGGSDSVAAGLTLAHSHAVDSHVHSQPAHTHELTYTTTTSEVLNASNRIDQQGGSRVMKIRLTSGIGTPTTRHLRSRFKNDGATDSGSAAPGTDSQLTDFVYKYFDVIVGSKDA